MRPRAPTHLDLARFPIDPWRLVEREYSKADLGLTETIFAVGNGYFGMRANPEEGRDAYSHGTYVNGFHETWHIHHAEEAFGFAKTGQTIVNVPDAKLMKLYVDDEPLLLSDADLESYERVLDFPQGTLTRDLVWRTPAGKRVRVRSQRLVSLAHRHLAVLTFEVTLLDGAAPVVVSSQLLNRQDGEDEYHVAAAALGHGMDPRKMRTFDHRVLVPRLHTEHDGEVVLGYRCANSGMTLACAYRHIVETTAPHQVETPSARPGQDGRHRPRSQPGQTLRLVKLVSYHTSTGVPGARSWPIGAIARCSGPRPTASVCILDEQRGGSTDFWDRSDVELLGDEAGPAGRAVEPVPARPGQRPDPGAGDRRQGRHGRRLRGPLLLGHRDLRGAVPRLHEPRRPPASCCGSAGGSCRRPASGPPRLNQVGALYPWRTINGEEASAYYAAGTAQYHINAAIAFALKRYLDASGDIAFLAGEGAELLVETARLWEDLGFFSVNGEEVFRIHGVTGPDEYTTVVNDNLYTNVMARFNMRYAARVVDLLDNWDKEAFASLCRRVELQPGETKRWIRAADAMFLPYDDEVGIHPQDDNFLEREPWDFENTPADHYPLLLHYHPLVIYRHQVLKQADVVLAMALRSDQFPLDVRRRNFDYYDPITTGDSSLSACVQAMAAAQIGYDDLAVTYFRETLFVDLADTHGNANDGVHVASAGGVWGTIAFGFAGLFDSGTALQFTPSLPSAWEGVRFRMQRHGARMLVELDGEGCTVTALDGPPVPLHVEEDGEMRTVQLEAGSSQRIPRVRLPAPS